jgi:hypothetical protein
MSVLARVIAGFFRFWYDFLIGDAWEIAAGVAAALVASVLLVRSEVIPEACLPLLLAAAVMVLLVGSVVVELRRKMAQGRG